MRGLYILAVVLIVLFLLGQIRVGCRAEYSAGGLTAWARLGPLSIQIFPLKKKVKPEKVKKEGKKSEEDRGKKAANPPEEKPLAQKLGGALEYAQALLPILLEAAGRFYRKLQVDSLYLEMTVGAEDPADSALRYGQANAALGALWYPLTQVFHVKDGTARVRVDFDAREMALYGSAALSLKIGQIVWLGIYFGLKAFRAFFTVRKGQKLKQQQRKAA